MIQNAFISRRLGAGFITAVVFATACGGVAPCGGAVDAAVDAAVEQPASPDRQLCQASCNNFVGFVCADQQPNCVESCVTSLAMGVCLAETRALLTCGIAAGPTAFECTMGHTIIKETICTAERTAMITCVRSPNGAAPNGGG